jgi:hypothetical protein
MSCHFSASFEHPFFTLIEVLVTIALNELTMNEEIITNKRSMQLKMQL